MKLLLTSNGITNKSIHNALVGLLGKPIAESDALFIPTAVYPFPNGAQMAWQATCGKTKAPFCQLGWRSLGILELTALPGIKKDIWLSAIHNADALLVWGGDVLYLSYWMHQSGLAHHLPSLFKKLVYVGMSAGSMVASNIIGETYDDPPGGNNNILTSENMTFHTLQGEVSKIFVTTQGVGLVDFALIPHMDHQDHADASEANAEKWAAKLPVPVYAIDDNTAIQVVNGIVEVVSEGNWKLFNF